MLISVASERSKKFRSIGANLNDISSKVSTISKTVSTNNNGVLDNSIGSDALSSNSVNNNNIASQSITADKLDISSVSSPGSNQRIPAPLNSIEYWSPVLAENSALHTEPYFKDVKIRNVSVDANGLTFSPERATPLAITNAGIENGVVTLVTNVAHGYEAGDTVQITGLSSPFAGEWLVSEVPPMSNATTTATGSLGALSFTVASATGIVLGMTATATGIPEGSIVTVISGTTITIDQAITTALSTTSITFSGSKTICYSISRFNQIPINYKIGEEIAGEVYIGDDRKIVTSKSCSNGIVTLSVQNRLDFTNQTNQIDNSFSGHGYSINDVIEVSGLGSPYDGTHLITDVPDGAPAVLKYSILNKTIGSFSTSIQLESALGDGLNVLYTYSENASINAISSLDFYTNEPVTITGFSDTNYNTTGVIESVGSSSFTVKNDHDTLNTPATAGSPQVIVAHVKVDAEARLFLTGKTKVPDSRSISVSWVTDGNPINMYFVCWITNRTGSETAPLLIPIDETQDLSISKLQGVNNYHWEIPDDVEQYSLLAEVLPGWSPVLLKEAYVFEAIGDQDKKTERISSVSITNNVATIYTATTHPYVAGDIVQMFGLETANSALVGTSYEVDTVSDDATSFNVITVGLSNTSANVSVSGTVIGGHQKEHISSVSPSGLALDSALGQSINLTDDPTDNYLTITNATADAVASISNTGAGTFKTLDADSLSVDGDITIGGENTSLVGTTNATHTSFIDAKFNGKSYGGALFDRLARGTIYQAYWVTPSENVATQYHGLAAGTFKLDSNRLYQVYASSSGMRASVNTNVALEFLISTTPIRVENDTDLSHLSYTHPSQTYTTSTPNNSTYTTGIGNDSVFTTTTNSSHSHLVNVTHTHSVTASHTHTVSVFTSSFWRDLAGHFYSTSPTPVANNTTKYSITSFTRDGANANANVIITLPNVAAKYMESTDDITKMFVGVSMNNRLYNNDTNGTYKLTKINRTQFRFVSPNTTAISLVQRVQNLQATLTTGSNTITLTSGVTTNIANGQMLIKTSTGGGAFGNGGVVYVIDKTNPSTLVVGYANGDSVNHFTAGAITFEASAGEITLVDPIMTNTKATFSNAYQTLLEGAIISGSNAITGIASTADIAVGDTIYKVSGTSTLVNTTVVSITNSTAIVVANNATGTGTITFDTNRVVATSDGTNHTYIIPNLFQAGQLVDVDSEDPDWSITAGTIVSANSTQFVIRPSGNVVANASTTTGYVVANWSDRQVQLHRNYLPSETDLYYVLRLRHQVTPSSYAITLAENPNSMLAVTDLGQAKDMNFVAQENAGSPWTSGLPIGYNDVSSTDTTIVTETQTLSASDSAYYDKYGKGTGTSIPYSYLYHLYQGNPGDAAGTKKSAVLFPAFDFTGKTSGLTITKLEVYLRNRHSYNSNGLTAYITAHNDASLGSSLPVASTACSVVTAIFTKGQGKWVTLPSSWHDNFDSNGTCRGILLGITNPNTDPDTYYEDIDNYGYFDGINLDDAPQIRITYRYNSNVGSQNSSGGGGSGGDYIPV